MAIREIVVHRKIESSFVPANEMGVVYLFAVNASLLGFRVEMLQAGFPDCIAFRKHAGGETRLKIELEYRSMNFLQHGHDASMCDCIVCWHHDWADAPDSLEIIELKRLFHVPWSVWIQGAVRSEQAQLALNDVMDWAVRKDCAEGDLLVMYRCSPIKSITDVFIAKGELHRKGASWRCGTAIFRRIERVCSLKSWISLDELRSHAILKDAAFVRANMQGPGYRVTKVWDSLYALLVSRNPDVGKSLEAYAPASVIEAACIEA